MSKIYKILAGSIVRNEEGERARYGVGDSVKMTPEQAKRFGLGNLEAIDTIPAPAPKAKAKGKADIDPATGGAGLI